MIKLSTLAIRNIKRNFKRYVMYFFSLSFSVFTAYSFLALLENEQVSNAFIYDDRYRALLLVFGIIIMVFVMFFLISSNNSFIRARKKEISTYSLFGMTNRKIGKLLFIETMIVGLIALALGIGVGIFLSKLTAMILLDISLVSFTGDIRFNIAHKAVYITTLIFLAIFCLMGLSGLRVINKFELIDLFKADKMAESNSEGSIIALILSLLLIGAGYYLAIQEDSFLVVGASIPILVLVISGTYLFFWGGLSKVLHLIKKNKGRHYKAINLISISMFSHRIKSIASTMATIAVLSAVATTAIATGFTLYRSIEKNVYDTVRFDMYFYGGQEEVLDDVYKAFERHKIKILDEYTTQRYKCSPDMEPIIIEGREITFDQENYFRVYSESEYNRLNSVARLNLKPVHIKPGEAMFGYPNMIKGLESKINGKLLKFSNQTLKITAVTQKNILAFGAVYTLVLNDSDFDALYRSGDIVVIDPYGEPLDKVTVFKFENPLKFRDLNVKLVQILEGKTGSYRTAYNHYSESLETFGLVCFIGFFMSVVFILMTASLLYFKQIMAAEEEGHQYKMLRKIGMDMQVEKKVIVKRLFPVFLIPLVVGIIHSIFAMKAADTVIFSYMIPVENSYLTVLSYSGVMYGVYALVYGIFYFITKGQYSRIVK